MTRLLQQTKLLNPEEREEFLQLLKSQSLEEQSGAVQPHAKGAEGQVAIRVPPKLPPQKLAELKAHEPIELPGGPLSDDIIRDRR